MHDVTPTQGFPAEARDSTESRTRQPEPDMRVSVVVPTYNAAARLEMTIRSVLAQTRPPHEIIIIDDGCTDDTKQVCEAFGDAVMVITVPNGGQQRARNLGVERATSAWISFLDHDDLWDPDYLAEVAEFQRCHAVDLIFCNSRIVLEDGSNQEIKDGTRFTALAPPGYWPSMGVDPADRWSVLERYGFAQYLGFHPAQPSVTTIRKDFFQLVGGYDERMRGSSAENFEFEMRALRSARVGLLWRSLVSITRHAANASADGSKMAMDLVECLRFGQEHHELTPVERSAVAAELQRRLPSAIDGAFTLRRFADLCDYERMLSARLGFKVWLKSRLARLPKPVAHLCADLLTGRTAVGNGPRQIRLPTWRGA
jgi:hypothetical protein